VSELICGQSVFCSSQVISPSLTNTSQLHEPEQFTPWLVRTDLS
jgi:hypothetical protein